MWGGSGGEEEVFVSPDFTDWFIQTAFRDSYIAIFVVGHCIWRTGLHFKRNCLFLKLSFDISYRFSNFSYKYIFLLINIDCLESPILTLYVWKNLYRLNAFSTYAVSTCAVSTCVAVLGTNYEVTSGAESIVFYTCHKVCCYANLELVGGRSGIGVCQMFFHATVQCIFWIRSGIAVTCYGCTNVILYSFLAIVT
jgi:hypothetical protein